MTLTVLVVLVFAALICTLLSASKRLDLPLWVAVLLLALAEVVRLLPLR
jgi:hypothetical protein